VVFEAGSPTQPPSIVELDLATGSLKTIRRAFTMEPEIEKYYSIPEAIEFDTENNQTAHAFFYAPRNPDFEAPADERPPLIVECHGGPTGSTSSTLDLKTQYWTSRGFAVLDVNYGGSTGYGRAYRERLFGQWGIVDVDDCVNGAQSLVRQGLVDGERLIIKGGSAGGYTTLAALAFRDVFKAGASHYGVSDLEALALETHKFESRYLDSVVGPYPARRDVYLERSPIHHVDSLSAPVIFFQGSEDKVVPPSQAERMLEALRAKGVPASYVLFEGEQHGFRAAANIKYSLDAELFFYAMVLLRKGVRF
jgi:dipeptidyl aminopeptidase/acylaminoacyl peptidase